MSTIDLIDENVRKYLKSAKENDPDGQRALHSWLFHAINHLKETGEMSDFVFEELRYQHISMANGESSTKATRTEKPQNAPRQAIRDEGIYRHVKVMLDGRENVRPLTDKEAHSLQCAKEMAKAHPRILTFIESSAPQKEVFKAVAKNTKLSWETVKRIYYKEKKERE